MKQIHVGNGCGFWGDSVDAPVELVSRVHLDYLTLEYLAELTMSILAVQKGRDPQSGYATDFPTALERLAPLLLARPGLKIITNAGGMNPSSCAAAAGRVLAAAGLHNHAVAVVEGDDLLPLLNELQTAGHELRNIETGEPFESVRDRVVSANAYLGSPGIAEALSRGASVVITGRVADAALTVGPAAYEFGWRWDDWDVLCAGTAAGHLLECGAQATGGLWCDWLEADLPLVGYPVTEIDADGSFVLTKPPGTGGAVNRETAGEQLLYEVGDPAAYLTPDVTADFTSLHVKDEHADRVRVSGAKGRPAPGTLKVSAAYRDGYAASGTLVIFGPDAPLKAAKCGEFIKARLRRAGMEPERFYVERLGAGDCVPGVVTTAGVPAEVVLRVHVHDPRKNVVERFTKELAPLVTSGPPGVSGYTGGRASVREVFAYWPALIDRRAVTPVVRTVK